MAYSIAVSPPYKGENFQFPLAVLQSPYCERMKNFNNADGIAKVRLGNTLHFNKATSAVRCMAAYGSSLLAYVAKEGANMEYYDITTTTPSSVLTVAGDDTDMTTLYFNGYLFFFGSGTIAAQPRQYTGSAWGAATYSWPASFEPFGGNVYKSRAYFIKRNSSSYGYSEIDGVSGTVTQVDAASLISKKGNLVLIRAISMTQNLTPDAVQCFLFSTGEALVYRGGYPNSPTWEQIARFQVSEPIGYRCGIDAKGDTFIITKSEILSLRNLFASGYDQERAEGIGAAIKNRWEQIYAGLLTEGNQAYVQGVYDEKNDRLIIMLPYWVNPDTGAPEDNTAAQLVYDFTLGGWYEYVQTTGSHATGVPLVVAAYFNGVSYFGINGISTTSSAVITLETKGSFIDDDADGSGTTPIDFHLRLAPLSVPKFGVIQIDGVEVIVKSDLYAQTNYKLIADFGKQTTGSQQIEDQGASIARPNANVGITNAMFVQVDISGATTTGKTVGLELYAFNVWYDQGEIGSR